MAHTHIYIYIIYNIYIYIYVYICLNVGTPKMVGFLLTSVRHQPKRGLFKKRHLYESSSLRIPSSTLTPTPRLVGDPLGDLSRDTRESSGFEDLTVKGKGVRRSEPALFWVVYQAVKELHKTEHFVGPPRQAECACESKLLGPFSCSQVSAWMPSMFFTLLTCLRGCCFCPSCSKPFRCAKGELAKKNKKERKNTCHQNRATHIKNQNIRAPQGPK